MEPVSEQSATQLGVQRIEPEQLGNVVDAAEIQPRFTEESRLFAFTENGQLGVEQLTLLTARLKHVREQFPLKRLLITSAVRAEGKTSVAANLALMLAGQGNGKVLLVDADLRKPDIFNLCGARDERPVNFLHNGAQPNGLIRRVAGTELYLMGLGPANKGPLTDSGLLKLKMLLDQVTPAFDIVIMDTPPVLLVSDVTLLLRLCDAALIVVRASQTPRELAQRAKEMLEGIPIIGSVLTCAAPEKLRYGYGYKYGYGYENPPQNKWQAGKAGSKAETAVPK